MPIRFINEMFCAKIKQTIPTVSSRGQCQIDEYTGFSKNNQEPYLSRSAFLLCSSRSKLGRHNISVFPLIKFFLDETHVRIVYQIKPANLLIHMIPLMSCKIFNITN